MKTKPAAPQKLRSASHSGAAGARAHALFKAGKISKAKHDAIMSKLKSPSVGSRPTLGSGMPNHPSGPGAAGLPMDGPAGGQGTPDAEPDAGAPGEAGEYE